MYPAIRRHHSGGPTATRSFPCPPEIPWAAPGWISRRSSIAVFGILDGPKELDQFPNAVIECITWFPAGRFGFLVADQVIALVNVLADRRFHVDKLWYVPLDRLAQLKF